MEEGTMRKTILGSLLALIAVTGHADTLLLDGLEANLQTAGSRPSRGMTMDRVEARFGAPLSRTAAVGDPPITRWQYESFVVYFEYQHVVHSAVRH
jgi:hypothetical protein